MTEQAPGETTRRPKPARRPRRAGRSDVIARVALVLVLLGVAVQGLSGRRHLDWAAISDAPGSTWIGLVLVAAASFVVVVFYHALAKLLRIDVDDDQPTAPLRRPATWYAYLAVAAVLAVAILLVYLLLNSAVDLPLTPRDQGGVGTGGVPKNPPGEMGSTDKWALLVAVLAGAGLAIALAAMRRRDARAEEALEDDDEEPTEQSALAGAVAAAELELDSHRDDTRAAIIAAYLAMERQLVASGTARQASDTPTDFLLRAVATSKVSRGSAARLTELFREARFSTHPMATTARADAARALARVADDLAHDQAGSRG